MKLYQVRLLINDQWRVVQTYAIKSEALLFAQLLEPEWDVKEISLVEANLVCA